MAEFEITPKSTEPNYYETPYFGNGNALTSTGGGLIMSGGEVNSSNFVKGISGWQLSNTTVEFNVITSIKKAFKAAEDLTAGNAVRIGKSTYSANFVAASSQRLSVADTSSLSITNNLTFECWVYFATRPGAGASMGIASKWNSVGDQRSYNFYLNNNGGVYELTIQTSADGAANTISHTDWTPTAATWYHIAFVFRSGVCDFYVNGVLLETTAELGAVIKDSTASFYLGQDASAAYLNGRLDEVRVWSVARTATEIAENYNKKCLGTETGLQAYWELEDSLLDTTANNNDLTNENVVTFVSTSVPPLNENRIWKTTAATAGSYEPFIGFVTENIASGDFGGVTIVGEVSGFTGLSSGSYYYLSDTAGGISINAGSNTRKVGIATSNSTLLITNIW